MGARTQVVAREPELAFLDRLLSETLDGHGQVCFLAGDAGAGKTTLLEAFLQRAQQRHPSLVIASGVCDAQAGSGDPYLPFREIFAQLTGASKGGSPTGRVDDENQHRLQRLVVLTGDILMELGPDLLDLFVPGVHLITTVGKVLLSRASLPEKLAQRLSKKGQGAQPGAEGLNQGQIFEQYINVISALAEKAPLVITLDDLHWADNDSIELLFRLGRRLERARILLIGTYRPSDLSNRREQAERHPLSSVLSELKRYHGDIELDLDGVRAARGREFVNALLDSELNCLNDGFREMLFQRTGGHPLFTVELLRHLETTGGLARDELGCWMQDPALDWKRLPSRLEGVFAERIARLSEALRGDLQVACVEGEQFTAEVVARVRALEARALVQALSGELARAQRLLESEGVARVGDQRLSRYRFSHQLFQSYLYQQLDDVERSYLHEDVGSALEALYGSQAEEIAVVLALHFEQAGAQSKARHYLRLAAQQALARHAAGQALEHATRALALTPAGPSEDRLALLMLRSQACELLGDSHTQDRDLSELEALAPAGPYAIETALQRAQWAHSRSDYARAIEHARAAAGLAAPSGEQARLAAAHRVWGLALRDLGDYEQAAQQLEQARDLAEAAGANDLWARSVQALGAIAYYRGEFQAAGALWRQALERMRALDDRRGMCLLLRSLGLLANRLGQYDEAHACTADALRLAHEVGDRPEESRCLNTLSNTARFTGDLIGARDYLQRALATYQESGNRAWEGLGLMNLGFIMWDLGDYPAAQARLDQALAIQRETGNRWAQCSCLANLAMVARDQGRLDEARQIILQGLQISREIGARDSEGEMLVELGQIEADRGDWSAARAACQSGLAINREVGSQPAELEAMAGLAQALMRLGEPEAALELVAGVLAAIQADPLLRGTQRPMGVYDACLQTLRLAGDARAPGLLAQAGQALRQRSARLAEPAARAQYEQIPVHQALLAELARATSSPD